MADISVKSGLISDGAKLLEDDRDHQEPAVDPEKPKDELEELTSWVITRVRMWRDFRRSNYELAWDQYERLWRGMWSTADKSRDSERSTLITPGLAEAVENIVAEVEEALFGRGDSFDIKAKFNDGEDAKKIVDENKAKLKEDLGRADFNANIGEALINAAVYGSGIGEIVVDTFMLREIAASVQAAYGQSDEDESPDEAQSGETEPDAGDYAPTQPSLPGMPPMPPQMQQMPQPLPPGPAPMGPVPGQMTAGATGMPPMTRQMGGMLPPRPQIPAPMGSMSPMMPAQPLEATVIEREVSYACLQSVNPRNFLIDPTARTIDKALGVAIEEYVGAHIINEGQRKGKYRKVDVETSAGDTQLGADRQAENEYAFDKVHVVRYYGLVPKHLLFPPGETVDLSSSGDGDELGLAVREAESAAEDAKEVYVDLNSPEEPDSEEPIDSEMIEACIYIANDKTCIKAIENPYLMKDRPVVAFPWDVVPGRFWGRGVCEKGLVPQKVMDAELRARIDSLAFVSAPMMGMDASRLPRGFQLTVRPGKSILTNGDPNTVLRPMHFGQLDQSTFTHSQQLDQMIQRATGSLDVMALAQRGGSDARPGAVSMMLSGIVKRHKRTLMNFVDRFYVPALRKVLWRNMQYNPDRYTPRNWDFVASSTMGILQREYESANLVQLMQTMEPGSPEYKMLLMGVVANTGLTHRREIIEMLKQSIQTAQMVQNTQAQQAADPQTQQLQTQLGQVGLQLQIAETQAKIAELGSRTRLQDAKAANAKLEPQFKTAEIATKGIYQVSADKQKNEFDRRMALADRVLKERDIASNERIATVQSQASVASQAIKARAEVAAAHHAARGQAAAATPKPVPVPVPHPVPVPILARSATVLG